MRPEGQNIELDEVATHHNDNDGNDYLTSIVIGYFDGMPVLIV